jgi:hypothetical protein
LNRRKIVSSLLDRSRRAYGALFSALSEHLRLLVADVPVGYAYGVWSFLEKKFQNVEDDALDGLVMEFVHLSMREDEGFDAYRARVNVVHSRLVKAIGKEDFLPRCYSIALVGKLTARYRPVVAALRVAGKLKDPAKVSWDSIAAVINEHERAESRLDGGTEGRSEGAMSAYSSQRRRVPFNEQDATCHLCGKRGHIRPNCPQRHAPPNERLLRSGERIGAESASSVLLYEDTGCEFSF